MKSMTSAEVREAFLDYFEEMRHHRVASSSLVPGNDPTLLFANSGMVQFKDVFLGNEQRDYTSATTSQKVMRVSGKHNDLEEVGPSPRHQTFFEMLGNFSFGDYFKLEAMQYAWELLTKVYDLPADRLAVTIYEKDDESYDLWTQEIGISPKRIARLGPDDNFWQMAETGPCGPNTEIHWDKYPERGEDAIIASLEADDDRFLELWNLVFMQFNRTQPDPDHSGQYDQPLPKPGVDTGLGLERLVSVLQGAEANYETDLFMPIIEAVQRLTGHSDAERDANIVPYRVIADHMRAAVFLIADGVLPGAKGRDSVTRLVIRRAARFGAKLGFNEPFLGQLADSVINVMSDHFTELAERTDAIKKVITQEEIRFRRTMDRGLGELGTMLDELKNEGQTELSGENAFYLKATLGLPLEVTRDIAEERGFTVDMAGYSQQEALHAEVSGGGQAMGVIASAEVYNDLLTDLKNGGQLDKGGVAYDPYGPTSAETQLLAILSGGQRVERVIAGDKVEVVLAQTPFYVEAGGQVSDTGTISGDGWAIEVEDMQRPVGGLVVHVGEMLEGTPQAGDAARAEVAVERRADITRNHTATHLLHAALRNNLGTHVQQRGSLVAPDRLRFDFAHDDRVAPDQMRIIEREVNDIIMANYAVQAKEKSLTAARQEGAMALFGEKYDDTVRTISIVDNGSRYSYELCGGVHVVETAEIGQMVLTSEGSVSAGIRRVEALTGRAAHDYIQANLNQLQQVAQRLGTTPENTGERIVALQGELADSKKEVANLRREIARNNFNHLVENMEQIENVPVLIAPVEDVTMDTMREMSDWFRNKVDSGVLVLGTVVDDRPQLLVAVTDDLTKQGLHAGKLIKEIASRVGGGGGGRPNLAQAGGHDAGQLPAALERARQLIAESYQQA